MEKIKNSSLSLLFVFSFVFFSCSEEKPAIGPLLTPIQEFHFNLPNDTRQFSSELTYLYNETIVVDFPQYYPLDTPIDLTHLKLSITLESGCSLTSPLPEYIDLSTDQPFRIEIITKDNQKLPVYFKKQIVSSSDDFSVSKGVNVASWLSLPLKGTVIPDFFTEANVIQLKNLGFDHIRLLVDEEILFNNQGQPNRNNAFDLLNKALGWCVTHNMKVIVDMHVTRNHSFTNLENNIFTDANEPVKFVELWKRMSKELNGYPNNIVAYELLNEPITATLAGVQKWNTIVADAITAIRVNEPRRTIIVGVCTESTTFSVRYDLLSLPVKKNYILMTFHFYTPYLLTAFGQLDTTNGRTDIAIQYPGQLVADADIYKLPTNWQSTGKQTFNIEVLRPEIMKGINKAKSLDVPVFMGEFGTLSSVPEISRLNWYRDVISILHNNGVGYTSFDYKGAGYSIVNESNQVIYPNLVKVLTGKE